MASADGDDDWDTHRAEPVELSEEDLRALGGHNPGVRDDDDNPMGIQPEDSSEVFFNRSFTVEEDGQEGFSPTDAGVVVTAPDLKLEPPPQAEAEPASPQHPQAAAPEEDDDVPDWTQNDKHVFILSSAGKPIYTRHGNEDKMVSLMGVMQALVSFVQDEKDQLRSFTAGNHKFVFLVKTNLLLVMVASTGEDEAQMMLQLTYVYSQIIFVLTHSQLTRIFEQRANYDLRRMLSGTEKFIDNLLDLMNSNPSFFLGAVRCLPLRGTVRDKIGSILQNSRINDLVFAVLIADNQLITLLRPKKYSLHPADLHLIFNLVSASSSFRTAESWTPLCLPKFNNTGFLHAHVSYIDDDSRVCLLLISNNKDAFFELSSCRAKIVEGLQSSQCLQAVTNALAHQNYKLSLLDIPSLRHFLYKVKSTAQFTSPAFEPPYNLDGEQLRLFRRYQFVHHCIHAQSKPLKICFHVGAKETMLGLVTPGFELYAAFGPLVTKPTAMQSVFQLIRWMKHEEDRLFIINSQVF
eukprot:m.489686 g.489686  ORF g.489686 m.489686 type:complete len:520 (+) comp27018_c0_seq1:112-1671(+)